MKKLITLFAFALVSLAGDPPVKKDITVPQEDQDDITRALFNLNDANSKLSATKAAIPDLEKAVADMKTALNKILIDVQAKNGASSPGCQVENVNVSTVEQKEAKPGMWKIACPVTEGSK